MAFHSDNDLLQAISIDSLKFRQGSSTTVKLYFYINNLDLLSLKFQSSEKQREKKKKGELQSREKKGGYIYVYTKR